MKKKITQYSIQKKISTYQIPSICLPMDTSAEKITNSWCDVCTDFTTLINVYVDVRLRCNKLKLGITSTYQINRPDCSVAIKKMKSDKCLICP